MDSIQAENITQFSLYKSIVELLVCKHLLSNAEAEDVMRRVEDKIDNMNNEQAA